MEIREIKEQEKEKFNKTVGHPVQSWEWGEFRQTHGNKILRLGLFDKGRLKEGFQLTIHGIPKTNFRVAMFTQGPEPSAATLKGLKEFAQKENLVFVRIEPAVVSSPKLESLITKNNLKPSRPFFNKSTYLIDLTKSEKELLFSMHSKTRYNIRLAERHGVVVESSTPDNQGKLFDEFYNLLRTTAARDRFHLHSATYYRKMMETLPNVSIFTARHKDEPLASALVIFFAGTATYLHGASGDRHRNLMAPHLLHWEIMRAAKADGNNSYDFWGIAPPDEPNHPWAGITRFKMGFCGEVATMPEALELPLHHFWYSIYRLAQRALP